MDLYSAHYDYTILLGGFNFSIDDLDSFCESYKLKSLIKDPTCFKYIGKPSYIDLILRNGSYSFQNSFIIEPALSNFDKMIVSVMKTTFQKLTSKIVLSRDYRNFKW